MKRTNLPFELGRNGRGELTFSKRSGEIGSLRLKCAFPLSAPRQMLSLIDDNGQEFALIEDLDDLEARAREVIEHELERASFAPEVRAIVAVSTPDWPSVWTVETDRGRTELSLSGEECLRRLGRFSLLIQEDSGLEFRIPDWGRLDRRTRRFLERFL